MAQVILAVLVTGTAQARARGVVIASIVKHALLLRNTSVRVARFPENVRSVWHYAATEMINNAIDH